MLSNIKNYDIILGSSSPRRKELLSQLNINFNIITNDTPEDFPEKINKKEIAIFLSKKKCNDLCNSIQELKDNFLLITADTIVLLDNMILNKPKDTKEAYHMLSQLSDTSHKVITGVSIKTKQQHILFSETSTVTFKKLLKEEITYYINNYNPLDKAGGYGVQDWIGLVGIKHISGSYSNIVGLPLEKLYEKLKSIK